jgi:hypothetical protein
LKAAALAYLAFDTVDELGGRVSRGAGVDREVIENGGKRSSNALSET